MILLVPLLSNLSSLGRRLDIPSLNSNLSSSDLSTYLIYKGSSFVGAVSTYTMKAKLSMISFEL